MQFRSMMKRPKSSPLFRQNIARKMETDWETTVKNNSRTSKSTHTLDQPGYHTLKFWMIDPGVVLQKIVVNTGGVRPSYLGPPESFQHWGWLPLCRILHAFAVEIPGGV